MGLKEMRHEVYEAAAVDALRDQVEILQARVRDDEKEMLARLERLEARFADQEVVTIEAPDTGDSLKAATQAVLDAVENWHHSYTRTPEPVHDRRKIRLHQDMRVAFERYLEAKAGR